MQIKPVTHNCYVLRFFYHPEKICPISTAQLDDVNLGNWAISKYVMSAEGFLWSSTKKSCPACEPREFVYWNFLLSVFCRILIVHWLFHIFLMSCPKHLHNVCRFNRKYHAVHVDHLSENASWYIWRELQYERRIIIQALSRNRWQEENVFKKTFEPREFFYCKYLLTVF